MDEVKIGLIGKVLQHSYSKKIHESFNENQYNLWELNENELEEFMRKKEFKGINVTIPYKETVIKYLDEINDAAKRIKAVNTIVNINDKLYGYNTDYDGFKYLLEKNNIIVSDKNCLILGTGGTSKMIKIVLEDLKAKNIYVASRNKTNYTVDYNQIYDLNIDIIINATPVGMYPNFSKQIVKIKKMNKLQCVIDVIYNPYNTFLLQEAKELNLKYVNGLDMLIYQAKKASELFFNTKYEDNVSEIARDIRNEYLNIVLIGLPGSGKSTVAKKLNDVLQMEVIDIDTLIENKYQKKISEIFKNQGEAVFRHYERMMIKKMSIVKHSIISTGGGVILNKINMKRLKCNGIVIYLSRDIDKIILDDNRPLSKNKEDLEKIYRKRKKLYIKYADFIIDNNNDLNTTIEAIGKVL